LDLAAKKVRQFNWGTAGIYSVALTDNGDYPQKHIPQQRTQLGGYEYQDCKSVAPQHALCAGVRGKVFLDGVIDLIRFEETPNSPSGETRAVVVKRIAVPNVDRMGKAAGFMNRAVPLTLNPMTFELLRDAAGKELVRFYFVPHDGPGSRLIAFDAPLN
jgi:hypothetical protein